MTKKYKPEDATAFKFASSLVHKLCIDLKKIKSWGTVQRTSDIIPAVKVDIDDDSLSIEMNTDTLNSDIRGSLSEVATTEVNKILEHFKNRARPVISILLDQNGNIMAYQEEKNQPYYYINLGNDVTWKEITFSDFADFAMESDKRDIVWRIGDLLMYTSNSWPFNILVAVVVNYYCDKYIPQVASNSNKQWSKVSEDGFAFLCKFLWEIVYGDTKNIPNGNIKRAYKELDHNKAIPHLPHEWNSEHIELINISKVSDHIDNFKASLDDEKESQQEFSEHEQQDALNIVNKVLNGMVGKEIDIDTLKSFDRLRLSEVIEEDFIENEMVWDGEIYTREFMIDVDCSIETDNEAYSIPEDMIAIAAMVFGVLEIIIPDGLLDKKEIEYIEDYLATKKSIGLFITSTSDIDDLVDKWDGYLKEANSNES